MSYPVAVLIGSLRTGSYSRSLAQALMALSPPSLTSTIVEIGELPLYNPDLEATPPSAWAAFRESMSACRAVLFVTPEYNRSVPACLKNAIDVGSRPYGKSVFDKKPAAVVSQSPGAMGGFGANHALRQSLVFLDMPVLQQPEAYVGHTAKMFDEAGAVSDDGTRTFLTGVMTRFGAWVETNAPT